VRGVEARDGKGGGETSDHLRWSKGSRLLLLGILQARRCVQILGLRTSLRTIGRVGFGPEMRSELRSGTIVARSASWTIEKIRSRSRGGLAHPGLRANDRVKDSLKAHDCLVTELSRKPDFHLRFSERNFNGWRFDNRGVYGGCEAGRFLRLPLHARLLVIVPEEFRRLHFFNGFVERADVWLQCRHLSGRWSGSKGSPREYRCLLHEGDSRGGCPKEIDREAEVEDAGECLDARWNTGFFEECVLGRLTRKTVFEVRCC